VTKSPEREQLLKGDAAAQDNAVLAAELDEMLAAFDVYGDPVDGDAPEF
jgi:hypothetical protein